MLHCVAGGNAIYAAEALQKVAHVVKMWPAKVQSSNELAGVKGVGKGTQWLVSLPFIRDQLAATALLCLHGC